MAYENYVQLLGRAGDRQIPQPSIGLSHNLGGVPFHGVAAIAILGLHA
jgi:acetyl-CoA C-acetyltransferase